MAAAIDAGASVVNDVTALAGDPEALDVVVKKHAPVVLMHMQGDPRTMQTAPSYTYAPIDVFDVLKSRVDVCVDAGIDRGSICIDPGIGFGKDDTNNLNLLDNLTLFQGLGCPVMLGASRKGFIGRLSNTPDSKDRLPGSLAAALAGVAQGVQILRVHDVAETKQAVSLQHAIYAQQLDQ
jgi:dihydropteroate synthase